MRIIEYDPVHDYLVDWLDNWLGRFKFDHRKNIVRAIINFVENQKVYNIDIDKQIAKKPYKAKGKVNHFPSGQFSEMEFYHCQGCDSIVLWGDEDPNENDAYCCRCGQKQDWSDFNLLQKKEQL